MIVKLKSSPIYRLEKMQPPPNKTVLFIWWFRGGFERSQKTTGFMNEDGEIILDFVPGGRELPGFWCYLNGYTQK